MMSEETLDEYIARNTEGIIEPGVKALAQSYLRYGAEWQAERMYSEEEVVNLLNKREDYLGTQPSIFDYSTNKEWLIKFGAIVRHNEYYNYDKFEIKRKDLKYSYFVEKTSDECFNISITQTFCEDIQYVHQLQNLYFSLTGEELTIS